MWCSVELCGGVSEVLYTALPLSPPPCSALSVLALLLSVFSYILQTLLGGVEGEARDAALSSLASELK